MNAYRQILKQSGYEMRSNGAWWAAWISAGLLAVACLGFFAASGKPELLGLAVLLPFGVFYCIWWTMFIQSAVRQNAPSHAQLVPYLRGRLIRVTAALWLAGALYGSLLGALFGHAGWGLLAVALFMLIFALKQRFPQAGSIPGVAILAYIFIPHPEFHLWLLLKGVGEPAVTAIGLPLMAIIGAVFLPSLYLGGGDRHRRWQTTFAYRLEAIRTGIMRESDTPESMHWNRLQRSAYTMSLKRVCADGATPAQMQMYALGPNAHWMMYAATPLVLLLLAIPARMLLQLSAFLSGLAPLYLTFIVMIPLGCFVQNVGISIYRTSTEQGLMQLAPGAVPASLFNRALARELLGGFFKLWLICAVSGVVLGRTFSGGEASWVYLLSLAGLMLPVSILLLRNYAAMGAPYGSSATALIAGGMLILTIASRSMKMLLWPQIWTAIGIASVLLTALLLVRGWRRMMAMPVAFPARRMA